MQATQDETNAAFVTADAGSIQLEAPTTQVPGGLGKRFAAVFVDGIILSIVSMPLSFLFGFSLGFYAAASGSEPSPVMVALTEASSSVASLIVAFFYYGWFYRNKGASPGKMMMKLRVSDSATGTNISYLRAGLRETVGKILSAILLGVGYLIAAFRQDKRALHDLMFKTQVTYEPK